MGAEAPGSESQQPTGHPASRKPAKLLERPWAEEGGLRVGLGLPAPFQRGGPAQALVRAAGSCQWHTPLPPPSLPQLVGSRLAEVLWGAPGHVLVPVNDGVEETAVPPAGREVVAAQAVVTLHHALGPQQELLLGRHVLRLPAHLDVGDLPHAAGRRSATATRPARCPPPVMSPRQGAGCAGAPGPAEAG